MIVTVCKGCGTKMMATDSEGKPACPICIGLNPESGIPLEVDMPDTVKCSYCKKEIPTKPSLPFLDSKRGTYYCGCRGWD